MSENSVLYNTKGFTFRDERYPFGGESHCTVDVFIPADWRDRFPCALVLFTDPGAPSGVSITNASEVVASAVWERFFKTRGYGEQMHPSMVFWMEYYPRTGSAMRPSLDQISYSYVGPERKFTSPTWRRVTKEKVAELEARFGISLVRMGFIQEAPYGGL